MQRVLLISANREHFPEPAFPIGAAYVASALLRSGAEVRIFDAGLTRFPSRSLRREIVSFTPRIIGLSLRNIDNAAYPCTQHYAPGCLEIGKAIRRVSKV